MLVGTKIEVSFDLFLSGLFARILYSSFKYKAVKLHRNCCY